MLGNRALAQAPLGALPDKSSAIQASAVGLLSLTGSADVIRISVGEAAGLVYATGTAIAGAQRAGMGFGQLALSGSADAIRTTLGGAAGKVSLTGGVVGSAIASGTALGAMSSVGTVDGRVVGASTGIAGLMSMQGSARAAVVARPVAAGALGLLGTTYGTLNAQGVVGGRLSLSGVGDGIRLTFVFANATLSLNGEAVATTRLREILRAANTRRIYAAEIQPWATSDRLS